MIEYALAYTNNLPLPDDSAYNGDFSIVRGAIPGHQQLFETLGATPPIRTKTTNKATTLKGRKLSHTIHKHRSWNIVISANELSAVEPSIGEPSTPHSNFLFLIDFWNADYRYLGVYHDLTTYPNYLEVEPDSDELPIELLEGQLLLPEVSFILNEVMRYG
jgi:hypothetical protein